MELDQLEPLLTELDVDTLDNVIRELREIECSLVYSCGLAVCCFFSKFRLTFRQRDLWLIVSRIDRDEPNSGEHHDH